MVAKQVFVPFVLAGLQVAAPTFTPAQESLGEPDLRSSSQGSATADSLPQNEGGPGCVVMEASLTASTAQTSDWFGESVAISGDTAVIGTGQHDPAAYAFVRDGTGWHEQAELTPSGFSSFDHCVAVSGHTALIGDPFSNPSGVSNAGSAFVFVRSGTNWSEQAQLIASDPGASDLMGWSAAVSGDTAVVGAHYDDHSGASDAGSAYVFVRNGTQWSQQAELIASDAASQDEFGYSVAISGDTIVVGAYLDGHSGSTNAGSAYVFVRNGTSWTEQAKLTASDARQEVYEFGYSVAVSDDTVVVGAIKDSSKVFNAGSAYVFVRNGNGWDEQAKLEASDLGSTEYFGVSVAVSGDAALIGASRNNGIYFIGYAAYVFSRSGTNWTEVVKLTDGDSWWSSETGFGVSTALDGDTALIGARLDGPLGGPLEVSGSTYVYHLCTSVVAYCTAGTSASGCQALLSASGTASATATTGFSLHATSVEGAKDGMFYFGTSGKQASPWGNGTSYQCVLPPTKRLGPQAGTGTPGACDGVFAQDLNATWCPSCPKSLLNPGPGATVQAQLWYRDPASTSNQTTSLSDAIEFGVAP